MKQKPTKDQLIEVLYENRVALFIIAMLILAAIIGNIQQNNPEFR